MHKAQEIKYHSLEQSCQQLCKLLHQWEIQVRNCHYLQRQVYKRQVILLREFHAIKSYVSAISNNLQWHTTYSVKISHSCIWYTKKIYESLQEKNWVNIRIHAPVNIQTVIRMLTLIPPNCLWVCCSQMLNTFLHILFSNTKLMSETVAFLTKAWYFFSNFDFSIRWPSIFA